MRTTRIIVFGIIVTMLNYFSISAEACSKLTHVGEDGTIVTGRTGDCPNDIINIWVMPRGTERNGQTGINSYKWVSKYGSTVVTSYDSMVLDGMNEKGLYAGMACLNGINLQEIKTEEKNMHISVIVQYILDNFSTVEEAVVDFETSPFRMSYIENETNEICPIQLIITDDSGDNAIIEYINDTPEIYHSKDYKVITDSLTYDKMLEVKGELSQYDQRLGMPGASNGKDRFARLSIWAEKLPETISPTFGFMIKDGSYKRQAVLSVLSAIRSISIPLAEPTKSKTELFPTLWRTVYNQNERIMYFDSAVAPTLCFLDFSELNFNSDASTRRLRLVNGREINGNAEKLLEDEEPFEFYSITTTEEKLSEKITELLAKAYNEPTIKEVIKDVSTGVKVEVATNKSNIMFWIAIMFGAVAIVENIYIFIAKIYSKRS